MGAGAGAGAGVGSKSRCCAPGTTCGPRPTAAAEKLAEAASRSVCGDAVSAAPVLHRNVRASEYVYSGEALRAVALPFGAVGGGSVALAGDGGLRQWQLCGQVNHTAQVPDSFFAVRTIGADGTSKSCVLMSNACYNSAGFTPAAYISDADVPPSSIALLSALPGVAALQITAQFPTAQVQYLSGEVPVSITQEVASPFIPLNSKDSGLPVVFFTFTVTNPTDQAVTVSLMQSQQNIGAWNGQEEIVDEVSASTYGGNTNNVVVTPGLTALDMSNPSLGPTDQFNCHVAIGALADPTGASTVTTCAQYAAATTVWEAFNASPAGGFAAGAGEFGASPAGRTWNGAVCSTFTLAPAASKQVTFLLGWHYPNKYVFWDQSGFGIHDPHTQFWIGNQYANVWPTIGDVLDYAVANVDNLLASTRLFRDSVYNSTLPWQVLDSAAPRASVLRSPTCMWNGDGNFYAFEGCGSNSGCCPLNCTHVWNYEMTLARLFPDLEATMRDIDLAQQIAPNAIIPSRTTVPLELRRQWSFWPNYTDVDPASTSICVDGEIGAVIKLYREVLYGMSSASFNALWPQAKKVMARWMTELDNGSGVIPGPQPNTYDCSLYGVNSFVGSLYLCALRAAEEMALLQGDTTDADAYHARFLLGSAALDAACFTNGKWYTQVVDPKNPVNELADGAFVDQLLGQWWAHVLGLGYLLPQAHVAAAVQNVFTANHRTSFDPAQQYPRKFFDSRDAGLYVGTWPDGPAPSSPMLYTSEGAWSGLEYPMAALAMAEGLTSVWTTMLSDGRARQDGTRRSPWNEVECGDHYSRPMAGWQLLEMASGQLWSAPDQALTFNPRVGPQNFQGIFITGSAWGQYSQTANAALTTGTATLAVSYLSQPLASLTLGFTSTSVTATVDGVAVPLSVSSPAAGLLTVKFTSPITVPAGASLVVVLNP